ncbi:MAG: DCL family protein [Alphaproteobacteria bacterium]
MLNRYKPEERVNDSDASDLSALLTRHNEYSDKLGCGIDYFIVSTSPDHSTKCFWIVRTDGSRIDFSFMRCVDQRQT